MNYNTIPIKLSTSTEQLVFTSTSDVVILGFQVANTHSSNLTEFDAFIRRDAVDAYIVKGFNVGTGVSRSPIDQKAKIILVEGDQLYVRINSGAEADVVVSYAVMEGTGSGGLLPVQEGDAGKVMVVKNTENGYQLASVQDVFLTISPSDAGKVVIVNETGTGYVVEDIVIPQELPSITGADEGKFLQVVSGVTQWVTNSLELPTASAEGLGCIKVGSGLSIAEGVLSADFYELPVAAADTLGGVKVGSNLSIDEEGILSSSSYTLPAATAGTRGGIRLGENVGIREGTTDMVDVTIPTASSDVLGAVKVGSGLEISEGVLSTTGGPAPVDSTPTGSVIAFAGASAPTGWLMCNGAAVSRTTYATLFSTLGTTYGSGDGSTTFNLPDLRGEFIRGLDGGRGVDTTRALGSAQASQNSSHSHTGSAASAGSHSHTASSSSSGSHGHSGSAASAGSHTHTYVNTHWGYGSSPIASGSNITHPENTGTTSSAGEHTHSLSISSAGAHSHSVTVDSGGAHYHTLSIGSSGGTEARPRNIAMNYIIKA